MVQTHTPKLRSACDACHEAKVKCTGGTPCVHCKNHHQSCHYSFAARIGKPKGSRNRKTLARLREASIQAAKSQTSCPTPPYALEPVPLSISLDTVSSTPEWVNPDYSAPTTQHASYLSYNWISPQSTPTPPESIDMSLNPLQLHDDLLMYQQQTPITHSFDSHTHSPQLSTTSASTGDADFIVPFPEAGSSYVPIWQSHIATCDCFQWQTSNLVSLHALKSPPGIMQHSTFSDSLQCITGTISACQRTLSCQSCEKSSSMMLFLIASLQMVFDHLESLLSREQLSSSPPSSTASSLSSFSSVSHPVTSQDPQSEQQNIIRMMQIRHMLIKTQNTLRDTREIAISNRQRSSIDSAISGVGEMVSGSPSDSDCLFQVLDKLQVGIGSLLSTIGTP